MDMLGCPFPLDSLPTAPFSKIPCPDTVTRLIPPTPAISPRFLGIRGHTPIEFLFSAFSAYPKKLTANREADQVRALHTK